MGGNNHLQDNEQSSAPLVLFPHIFYLYFILYLLFQFLYVQWYPLRFKTKKTKKKFLVIHYGLTQYELD